MRILITAGPTREYLDDVRYLSNGSSGRMGYAIADAARDLGHTPVLVSGPVCLPPPRGCEFHAVESSREMYDKCLNLFPGCAGVIAAAAVCDYTPRVRTSGKMSKTGGPLVLELVETEDVLAELGRRKEHRWIVGFALEAGGVRANALRKLREKSCDAILLNEPSAIGAENNRIELIDRSEQTVVHWAGAKTEIAQSLIQWINAHLAQQRQS